MRHGGDLTAAEAEFGRPDSPWLDLSTGINPYPYPAPNFSEGALTRLPQAADLAALLAAAREAYGWAADLPVVAGPGSQAMIQLLPYLRFRRTVAVLTPTYGEHVYLWERAGHEVHEIEGLSDAEIDGADVVVVVNPGNPTGAITPPERLAEIEAQLQAREGLLVIDEAFADVAPEAAYGSRLSARGTVVLRSFGKFFGLAGLRLGFAAGDAEMVSELAGELGPWPVSGHAIEAGVAALGDVAWISSMRMRLSVEAARLDKLLTRHGFTVIGGTDLFRTARHPGAGSVHQALARAGVWTRPFDEADDQLRFGLPQGDAGYQRLAAALKAVG